MKQFRTVLMIVVVLFSVSCASKSTPEATLQQYFEGLQKGEFRTALWDLKRFAGFYYGEFIAKAEQADIDKLVGLVERFAVMAAKFNGSMAANSRLAEVEVLEKTTGIARLKSRFVKISDPGVAIEITFVFEKKNETWKIVNYDRISFQANEYDVVAMFKQNLPLLLKDAGYSIEQIDLKLINRFLEEKVLKNQ